MYFQERRATTVSKLTTSTRTESARAIGGCDEQRKSV